MRLIIAQTADSQSLPNHRVNFPNASLVYNRSVSSTLDLMQHPSESDDGDGGDLRSSDVGCGVALFLGAVIDVSLNVVVGGVVFPFPFPSGGSALKDVAHFSLDILDHLAAVWLRCIADFDLKLGLFRAILLVSGDALVALESSDGRGGEYCDQSQAGQ